MKRYAILCTLIGGLAATGAAQEAADFRSPDINSETPDGALVTSASMAEAPQDKIAAFEQLLSEHPDSKYKGYVLFQLQRTYAEQQNHAKVIAVGKQLLEIAPEDLEIRHNINQAMVQTQQWEELYPQLTSTRPIAEKVVASPKPADEDEAAEWQGQVEYAEGVTQWLEWAANTALSQQTDPQAQITWMDRMRKDYPDSDYSKDLEMKYVIAYQQLGDQEKMIEWMQRAVDAGSQDPQLIYSLAESAYGKEDRAQARAYGEKMLEIVEADPPPSHLSEEDITKWTAYAHFVIGRTHVAENTKNSYRTGRTHLLKSVDVLKAEGGSRYHLLAYFLGVCYVQLDIQGDNIRQATFWMKEAARTDGPFKAQAADALKKIGAG
jgi:tetratricopeptide (TPR) repeat protein